MLKSDTERRKFIALNTTLQRLLDEQSDLELLLNHKIIWIEEEQKYKNWLDMKYAKREFDISPSWKAKVNSEKQKQTANLPDFDEQILIENEIKKKIYFKLQEKLKELPKVILKTIEEINILMDVENITNLTDEQLAMVFN